MVDTFFDIETTGLDPCNDLIITIQVKRGENIYIWKTWEEKNELIVIQRFLQFLKEFNRNEPIYGYNILIFDLPFILTRLFLISKVDTSDYKELYYRNWMDLYQKLGWNYCSIDKWLKKFGIERKCQYKGRDIPRLYTCLNYEEIENHAIDDLLVMEKLVDKLRKEKLV